MGGLHAASGSRPPHREAARINPGISPGQHVASHKNSGDEQPQDSRDQFRRSLTKADDKSSQIGFLHDDGIHKKRFR
jgi:hypothetical protein